MFIQSNVKNQEYFINSLQNAQHILKSLDRSIKKSSKYEKKLFQCKVRHHSHDIGEWWNSDGSEVKEYRPSHTDTTTTKSSKRHVDVAESWSTMSIVCLQYQYEELSKRYESLLQAYDERCNAVNSRDVELSRLRQRIRTSHLQLARAHEVLLSIGEKYLALRHRKNAQIQKYNQLLIENLKLTAIIECIMPELNEHGNSGTRKVK